MIVSLRVSPPSNTTTGQYPHILANKISRMFYPLLRTQNDQFFKGIMHIKLLDRMNNDRFISNFDILFWLLCISHAAAYSSG